VQRGESKSGDAAETRHCAVEIIVRDVQTNGDEPASCEHLLTKSPADCTSKEDVRAELDRIDQALLTLFAERHRYVTRMAEIKTDPHEAYDPVRIGAILSKQRKRADELGLDEDQAELIWKTLIDWNVNYEKGIIVARRGGTK
jgi:isochorismate pyruvate lyase